VPSGPDAPAPSRPAACLNCGSDQVEAFCARCGQRNVDMRVPARELMMDAVEDGLSLDSRVARTAVPFLLRPGFLTVEWTRGRRARFSSPLRLYLLASFVFFLATGIASDVGPAIRIDASPDEVAAAEDPAGTAPVPAGTEAQHEKLRGQGWLGRTLDERWKTLEKMPRQELVSRINTAFREWIPRVMFFLVPAAVLVLALLWRRRWLSEHVVLALHLHAFAFTLFTVLLAVRLLPWARPAEVLSPVLFLWLAAYFLLALRRVYGQPWRWTVPKAAVAALLYVVALGTGLAVVAALAIYFA